MPRLILAVILSILVTPFFVGEAGAKDLGPGFMLAKAGFQQCVEKCGMEAKKCYDKCDASGQGPGSACQRKCSEIQNKCHKKCHQLHD